MDEQVIYCCFNNQQYHRPTPCFFGSTNELFIFSNRDITLRPCERRCFNVDLYVRVPDNNSCRVTGVADLPGGRVWEVLDQNVAGNIFNGIICVKNTSVRSRTIRKDSIICKLIFTEPVTRLELMDELDFTDLYWNHYHE